MPRRAQRAGNNSVTHIAAVFQSSGRIPAIPAGFPQDDPLFNELWIGFTRARTYDDWLVSDLLILAHVVANEIEIRKLTKERNERGYIILNQRGTEVENPLTRTIDVLTRQQMARIRSLSLTAGGNAVAQTRAAAKADVSAQTIKDEAGDLLAN